MVDSNWCGVPILRSVQIILAILGLIVQLQTIYYDFLIVIYVIALVYLTMIFICIATNQRASSRVEIIIDLFLGICLAIYSVIIISRYSADIWTIIYVIINIVLVALFFLTAWDKQ